MGQLQKELKTKGFYLPKYLTTDSKGFLTICFGDSGFLDISGNRTAPINVTNDTQLKKRIKREGG